MFQNYPYLNSKNPSLLHENLSQERKGVFSLFLQFLAICATNYVNLTFGMFVPLWFVCHRRLHTAEGQLKCPDGAGYAVEASLKCSYFDLHKYDSFEEVQVESESLECHPWAAWVEGRRLLLRGLGDFLHPILAPV